MTIVEARETRTLHGEALNSTSGTCSESHEEFNEGPSETSKCYTAHPPIPSSSLLLFLADCQTFGARSKKAGFWQRGWAFIARTFCSIKIY